MKLSHARRNLKAALSDFIQETDDNTLKNIAVEILGKDDDYVVNFVASSDNED